MGTLSAAAMLGDPQDLRASTFPVPTFVPFSDPTLGLCEPKERRVSHTNPVFKALIFRQLIQTQVRREGKVVILKSRVNSSTIPSSKINF
jgi:hypothetical protein